MACLAPGRASRVHERFPARSRKSTCPSPNPISGAEGSACCQPYDEESTCRCVFPPSVSFLMRIFKMDLNVSKSQLGFSVSGDILAQCLTALQHQSIQFSRQPSWSTQPCPKSRAFLFPAAKTHWQDNNYTVPPPLVFPHSILVLIATADAQPRDNPHSDRWGLSSLSALGSVGVAEESMEGFVSLQECSMPA